MASSSFHLCVLFLFASLLIPTICHGSPDDDHMALFIFGDSLFDAGNNNYINTNTSYRANFWPYGETTFNYPTGRFSDGRLIPDFIAEYAKLPLIPPYKQPGNHQFINGVNFASGGAGALVQTHRGMVIDFKTQLSYFKDVERLLRQQLGDKEAKKLLTRAVYLVSIGSNDYIFPLVTNSSFFQSYSQEEYVEMVIGNITVVIEEIYKKGGRKFGFISSPPLGCLPGMRSVKPGNSSDCMEELNAIVKLHNHALSQVLQKQERQLKGFIYSNFDSYTSFSERMGNPSRYGMLRVYDYLLRSKKIEKRISHENYKILTYIICCEGFEEAKSACCGSGPFRGVYSCGGKRGVKEYQLCDNASAYLFFDSVHPTEIANQQFAKLMWNGTSNIAWPYNLKALFGLT
ncbi:hypothetical protein F0562_022741 [Nyssa sinensis]|uniref:SGNH hydrolase-type esterase domain-containing protein n=1 Tax=Nyssa sinensis TaxID=561372 RepID=A0A5J5BFS8_9ASTE|nr:hypothetical protein F0562_022741 [Nyssa sinensis]